MAERRKASRVDSRTVRALLSLGTVVGVGATGTYAYWTDSVPVSGTTISSGSIDLQVDGQDSVTEYAAMDLALMVPGNSTAGVLTVSNTGTSPLAYHVDAAASNTDGKGLGAALVVKVTGDSATSGSTPTTTCAGGPLPGSGEGLAAGLVGSATSPRTLAPGASETLCIQVALPEDAPASLQGATTNVTFAFSGTSF